MAALETRILALSDVVDRHEEEAVNVAVLAAATGRPWRRTIHDGLAYDSVTYERYGPDAAGNPVCTMPSYCRDVGETVEIARAVLPDARISMRDRDDGTWEASVGGSSATGEDLARTLLLAFVREMAATRTPVA